MGGESEKGDGGGMGSQGGSTGLGKQNRCQLVLLNPVTTNPSHYLNDLKGKVNPIPQPLGT